MQVISEKETENGDFDFYYCVQKFSANNFFWVNVLQFFQQIRTHYQILRFLAYIITYC